MKALLGALMCFVLNSSQAFAISGGPWGGSSTVVTTGTYAGLFVPTIADNSLGLFTVTIAQNGLGTGALALFRNGIFYPGTIQAIADPDSGVMTGVVSSSEQITFTSTSDATGKTTNTVITFNANGSTKTKIRANSRIFSTAAARIKGNASITYATVGSAPGFDTGPANGGPIIYHVGGFKQSDATQ